MLGACIRSDSPGKNVSTVRQKTSVVLLGSLRSKALARKHWADFQQRRRWTGLCFCLFSSARILHGRSPPGKAFTGFSRGRRSGASRFFRSAMRKERKVCGPFHLYLFGQPAAVLSVSKRVAKSQLQKYSVNNIHWSHLGTSPDSLRGQSTSRHNIPCNVLPGLVTTE